MYKYIYEFLSQEIRNKLNAKFFNKIKKPALLIQQDGKNNCLTFLPQDKNDDIIKIKINTRLFNKEGDPIYIKTCSPEIIDRI